MTTHISICPSICPSICSPVLLNFCLFVYLSISPSVYIYSGICTSICPPVCLLISSFFCLSVIFSVHLSIYLSFLLSICHISLSALSFLCLFKYLFSISPFYLSFLNFAFSDTFFYQLCYFDCYITCFLMLNALSNEY